MSGFFPDKDDIDPNAQFLAIPMLGPDDFTDEQHLTYLDQALSEVYKNNISITTSILPVPEGNREVLPVYTPSGNIDHYFSFGGVIKTRASPLDIGLKISDEFCRILSTLLISNQPFPQKLLCHFAIHHGNHWTSLVTELQLNQQNQLELNRLRAFVKSIKPSELNTLAKQRDYSSGVQNILSFLSGKNTGNLLTELNGQCGRGAFKNIHSLDQLQSELSKNSIHHPSPDDTQKWFVPYSAIHKFIFMDSLSGEKGYYNQIIQALVSQTLPTVPQETKKVALQKSNHCGDNTIWNNFCYCILGAPHKQTLSNEIRELTISLCQAASATNDIDAIKKGIHSAEKLLLIAKNTQKKSPSQPSASFVDQMNQALKRTLDYFTKNPPEAIRTPLGTPPIPLEASEDLNETQPDEALGAPPDLNLQAEEEQKTAVSTAPPPEVVAPTNLPSTRDDEEKATITTFKANKFLEKENIIQNLSRYTHTDRKFSEIAQFFQGLKLFCIALFTFNIFGLGFRKFLMARKLKNKLSTVKEEEEEETQEIIKKYDDYNAYLEQPALSWIEYFKPLRPEKYEPQKPIEKVPTDNKFYRCLHPK